MGVWFRHRFDISQPSSKRRWSNVIETSHRNKKLAIQGCASIKDWFNTINRSIALSAAVKMMTATDDAAVATASRISFITLIRLWWWQIPVTLSVCIEWYFYARNEARGDRFIILFDLYAGRWCLIGYILPVVSDREDVLFYWPISHRDWIGGFGVLSSFYEHSPVGNGTPHERTDRVHREKS